MKFIELNPRWIGPPLWSTDDPYYIGVRFSCPHCGKAIAVFFDPPIDPNRLAEKYGWTHTGAPDFRPRWRRYGDSFETLTLSPSIDVSGHWHGNITNGDVV